MEAIRHCCSAEETLSYRWLVTHNSSLAVADAAAHAVCSFIEMDPTTVATIVSTRWTIDVNGFHFATSAGSEHSFPYPSPPPPPLNSELTSLESNNDSNAKSTALVQGAASLKGILWRYYLCLLMPLRNKAKGLSLAIPKKPGRKRRRSRGRSSTTSSSSRTGIEWCWSNADVSVSDAILHCKKSYGSL